MEYLEPEVFAQMMAELHRERSTRQRLYPNWVREGKLTQQQADHRLAMLRLAIQQLEQLRPAVQRELL